MVASPLSRPGPDSLRRVATDEKLVGPFPAGVEPEAYDRLRRRVLWLMPSGLYVLGSRSGSRRNLMTLNWASQVASEPKLLAVSIERGAVTHALVQEGGVFSLNIIDRTDRAVVRKFVKPLPDDGGPSQLAGFAVETKATGAPILQMAAAWLECEVRQEVPCGSHTLFLGEIIGCGQRTGDDLEILRMEDTRMNYGG
jgi:flavin reductase (DIM6/NTAB) family NADH-FMN oxidoreductase RutF